MFVRSSTPVQERQREPSITVTKPKISYYIIKTSVYSTPLPGRSICTYGEKFPRLHLARYETVMDLIN